MSRCQCLTLIWVGFLEVRFKVVVGIMLESSNLVRKYIPICSFRKYTFQYLGPHKFADVSIFLSKEVPLLKAIVWELC